ncbi:MAG: hypothetical protein EXS25_10845 [Pedosphaera sp.]|nr:hypothetical protein [Pedosphaera sp.]
MTKVASLAIRGPSLLYAMPSFAGTPWRLSDALSLPEVLAFSGEQRVRYETLDHQFRAGLNGSDQALALRTCLTVDLNTRPLGFLAEAANARQYLWPSNFFSVNCLSI